MEKTHYRLSEASALFPSKPCKKTLLNWVHKGVKGVKLKAVCSGILFLITRESAEQFMQALQQVRCPAPGPSPETMRERKRRQDKNTEDLRRLGFKV